MREATGCYTRTCLHSKKYPFTFSTTIVIQEIRSFAGMCTVTRKRPIATTVVGGKSRLIGQ